MPEIAVNRIANTYLTVVEDANPNKNRIFINTQAYDKTTLAPAWMVGWHWTYNDAYTGTSTQTDWAVLTLSKSTIQCWSNADSQYYASMGYDTYHNSLDLTNYPAKRTWRTVNGRHIYIQAYGDGGVNATDSGYNLHYITGANAETDQAFYWSNWGYHPSHMFYEDITNNRMWGIVKSNANNNRISSWTSYETGLTGYNSWLSATAGYENFFLGVDNAGWPYYVWVGTAANLYNYYQVYKYNPTSTTATQVITNSYRGFNESYRRGLPSNIRRATADRRVFYGTQWDASGVFAPIRYVFDAAAGTVTATNCTMTYPGTDTYATYAERYTLEGAAASSNNSYFSKGYQFTTGGVNYITFWICDMASTFGSSASRWSTDKKRSMLTFTIGSGTGDDVLTYHSKVTFPGVNAMPRNFMAINSEGTHVVVPIAGATRFYSFNPSTGWEQTGSYAAEFRQLGLDSTNRLWGTSRERGFQTIHAITPSTPITVTVVMAAANYTYTGANIATTAAVNAYDSTGARVVASINLTIDGSSMLFTSNSSKNLTVSTSASADTTVNLTISGGGVNNIVASVNF
jgi:hypothetical protein